MANQPASYEPIPPEDMAFITAASERIRLRMKRTSEDIIEIGKDMIEVKERLNHGQFGFWLENEFDMTERHARRFMNVADRFGGKTDILSDFKPAILCELAAPSTPDEVVEKAQAIAASGEKVTVADVKKWKSKATAAEKTAKAAEKSRIEAEAQLQTKTAAQTEELSRLQEENQRLQESLDEALRLTPAPTPPEPTPPLGNVEILVPQQPSVSQGKQLQILLTQLQDDLRQPSVDFPHQVLDAMRNELLSTVTVIDEAMTKLTYQSSHYGENG